MKKVGMKYGLVCGLVYIIFGMAGILLVEEAQSSMLGILIPFGAFVVTFIVIFYGVKEFRDTANDGALKIGEAVKFGALVALIAALLTAAFNLLYHYAIDPEYMARMMETQHEMYEERGMSDEQIEQAMKWGNMFTNPSVVAAFTIVWYSLWGLVKGLVSGAILKREPIASV